MILTALVVGLDSNCMADLDTYCIGSRYLYLVHRQMILILTALAVKFGRF